MRIVTCGVFATLMLVGCSKQAAGDAPPPADAGSTLAAEVPLPKDDPCGLLTMSEIRRALPKVTKATREESLVAYGMKGCDWHGATGKAPMLEVRVWQVSGADDTPMDNARTLAMGVADPTRAGTQEAVRLEKLAGIGEDAVAIVEKTDEARGILTTCAFISLQKNGRIVTMASSDIAAGDRSLALEQLKALGKAGGGAYVNART